MKQLKTLSVLLLVLLTMALFTTSCKKDDDNPLVGTWVGEMYDEEYDGLYREVIKFKSNGSGSVTVTVDNESETVNFTWSATDHLLTTLWESEDEPEVDEYSISEDGKTLIWYDMGVGIYHKQ